MRKQVFLPLLLILVLINAAFAPANGGIGIKVRQESSGAFQISEILQGGPAEAAGVFVGEEIRGVDGTTVSRKTLEQVVDMIRGPAGTNVDLTLSHPSYPNLRNITIKRYELPLGAHKVASNK